MLSKPLLNTIVLAAFCALLCVLATSCSLTRAGYETAAYRTVASPEERIEIRQYDTLTLASTSMNGSESSGESGGFRRLFRYISGSNASQQKIAMTTPVFMQEDSMSFVLPKDVAEEGAPEATEAVRIHSLARGPYAVYRLRGARSNDKVQRAERSLRQWCQANQRTPVGSVIVAGYDPPFIPGPFQRNEVLLKLQP